MSKTSLRRQLSLLINTADPTILASGRSRLALIQSHEFVERDDSTFLNAKILGSRLYNVQLGEMKIDNECSCPDFSKQRRTCKHMVALALQGLAELKHLPPEPVTKFREVPSAPPRIEVPELLQQLEKMGGPKPQHSSPLLSGYETYYTLSFDRPVCREWSIAPFIAKVNGDSLQVLERLRCSELRSSRTFALQPLDSYILSLVPFSYRMHDRETPNSLLSVFHAFQGNDRLRDSQTLRPLTIMDGVWSPQLILEESEEGAILHPRLRYKEQCIDLPDGVQIFGQQEHALLSNERIFLLNTIFWKESDLGLLTQHFEISGNYLVNALPALLRLGELVEIPDSMRPIVEQGVPQPFLFLDFDPQRGELSVALRFAYLPSERLFPWAEEGGQIQTIDADNKLITLIRNPKAEASYFQELDQLMQNMTWSSLIYRGCLRIDLRHIRSFLVRVVEPLQLRSSWSLEGLAQLSKFQRRTAKVNLQISSGVDWFDLEGDLQFDDMHTSLSELLNLDVNEDEITLADGSTGLLPRDLVRLLRVIKGLREKEKKGEKPTGNLRIASLHAAVLRPLIENEAYHIDQRDQLRAQLEARALRAIDPTPVSKSLCAELRPYQIEGLHWLRQMRAWGVGGILADDMGLGKTVQVIAALCDFYDDPAELRPSLIVMPTSLLHNWKHELDRFAPQLAYQIYHGNEKLALDTHTPPPRTLIFTSYAMLRNDLDLWEGFQFGYAILDESQAIKNPLSQSAVCARSLNAQHRLAMTGTPIENNLLDLWSQFAFVNPGLLGSKDFFRKEFIGSNKEAPPPSILELLSKLSAPFYLRRTKEKVLTELPPLEERVLYVDMNSGQRLLYEKTKEKYRKMILGTIKDKGIQKSQIHILEGMLRLRQIACDPKIYLPNNRATSAKLELLVEKLQEDVVENHKALVFSQFTSLLANCGKALRAANIDYAYLDGSTRDRAKAIDEFTQQSNKRVFLISLKAGGTGLNLTTADFVFHLDPWWNPAVESQATGRAHRMGQTQTVQSIKMVASDSIEEKILLLQESKRQLAATVLQSDQGFVKSLDLEMVRELFA
jgi:SNF2 family DNA or RNA helicase